MKMQSENKNKTLRQSAKKIVTLTFLVAVSLIFISSLAVAQPTGPTVTLIDNSTKGTGSGTRINSSINDTITPGGYIFTANLNSLQQNDRWKAYVGNVTGTLTLDDANDYTIYQWSLSSVAGEVYATRSSGTINWTGINCTWISDGRSDPSDGLENSNRTPERLENEALSHTSGSDNVTATFASRNHSQITIGDVIIGKNECFSTNTWQNNDDAAPVFADSDDANFTQIILYDGAINTETGNVVYATFIEQDITGYDPAETYDFQMILPEDGSIGFSSSTAYYFYVELT